MKPPYEGMIKCPRWFKQELFLLDKRLYCWWKNDGYFYISYHKERTGKHDYLTACAEVVAKVGIDEGHAREPDMRDLWKLYRNDTSKHSTDVIYNRIQASQDAHKIRKRKALHEKIEEKAEDIARIKRFHPSAFI